ncbi:MAG: hypothetical protein V7K41_05855 [Nostoc sp.]|uniref:hypothetical protein n=1 Tax=Nostoc sp. TaxID=1180 RepID=UPI002FFC870F
MTNVPFPAGRYANDFAQGMFCLGKSITATAIACIHHQPKLLIWLCLESDPIEITLVPSKSAMPTAGCA